MFGRSQKPIQLKFKSAANTCISRLKSHWAGAGSNRRHTDFQSHPSDLRSLSFSIRKIPLNSGMTPIITASIHSLIFDNHTQSCAEVNRGYQRKRTKAHEELGTNNSRNPPQQKTKSGQSQNLCYNPYHVVPNVTTLP